MSSQITGKAPKLYAVKKEDKWQPPQRMRDIEKMVRTTVL
jgi:hypothetical protein